LLTRHVRDVVLNGQAQSVGHLPANQTMRLELVLGLRHQPELESFLHELYTPSSPLYRKFLTVKEFTERFGPSQQDYDAVVRFSRENSLAVASTSRNRMNVGVTGTVASIEKAFHVTLGIYQHPTEHRTFYAPDQEPTVDLPFKLWHVAGLDNYSIPHPLLVHRDSSVKSNATTGSGPSASFLGSDMRAAYYGGTTLTGAGQSVGLLEFYGTDLDDLNTYYANVGQTLNVPITLLSTDGTSTTCYATAGCGDTEQTLDMTQALGMAPGLDSLVMYVGSTDVAILNAMATASPLNAQLSSSWTWAADDPTTDDPYFQEFAAQGQNFFQASGDCGAWTSSNYYDCEDPPAFPSDDAYVTTVGGTVLVTSAPGGPWSSETAWEFSGGGVSLPGNDPTVGTMIPSWQVATAAGCTTYEGYPYCSQTYRNGPDVAAEANWDFYVCSDQNGCTANYEGGTSFAAPMWAGYLALANQQAVANGQSTLGFINPALYNIGLGAYYSDDFHDISLEYFTGGPFSFLSEPPVTGYDLATGWGSPNQSNLIEALLGQQGGLSFGLAASPTALTIAQGSTAPVAVQVIPYGNFGGGVTLSASGLPSGITASFNPNPATSTSTMTLTVAPSTSTSTYQIYVSGVSGTLTTQASTQIKIAPALIAEASLSPTSLIFAEAVGGTSKAQTITLSNTGTTEMGIKKFVASSEFTISSNTCGTVLLAGTNCKIGVTFAPTQVGVRLGSLTITDTAQGSPQTVSLSGTGTGTAATVTLTPASETFPSEKVGNSSPAKTFTLSNKASAELTNISITATGDFSVSSTTCAATLAGKSNCKIRVIFTPTKTGTRTGTLKATDSAAGGPQSASLTGTGK
jgi:kumamolisin